VESELTVTEDPKKKNIGCSPPDYPTAEYIAKHEDIYYNPNIVSNETTGLLARVSRPHYDCVL
jgi:hypothetical protein